MPLAYGGAVSTVVRLSASDGKYLLPVLQGGDCDWLKTGQSGCRTPHSLRLWHRIWTTVWQMLIKSDKSDMSLDTSHYILQVRTIIMGVSLVLVFLNREENGATPCPFLHKVLCENSSPSLFPSNPDFCLLTCSMPSLAKV